MENKQVLFIDDEPFFAEPYIRELNKTFDVFLEETAINAIDAVNSDRQWDAIILDIMMPCPDEQLGNTANGLDTGLWILGEIVSVVIVKRIPVIILTNRNLPVIQDRLDTFGNLNDIPVDLIIVRPKIETPRFILPIIVKSAIGRFHPYIDGAS